MTDVDGSPVIIVRYRSMTTADVRVVVLNRTTFGIQQISDDAHHLSR